MIPDDSAAIDTYSIAGSIAGLYPAFLVARLRIAPTLHGEVIG